MRAVPAPGVMGNWLVGIGLLLLALALLFVQAGGTPQWPATAPSRAVAALAALVVYAAFCGWVALSRRRQRQSAAALQARISLPEGDAGAAPVLVVYASQTGYAEQLAWRTAASLQAGGLAARVVSLGEVQSAMLADCARALFIVSTTGEGDAPDPAARFVREMAQAASLEELRYGLLALGDRTYSHYCGFGHALDRWLRASGAQALFDLVEVDDGDEGALRHWQHHLGALGGATQMPDWQAPHYQRWRLTQRRHLNPGSAGGAAFLLSLRAPASVSWCAGDIAEVGPRHSAARVHALLQALQLDGEATVQLDGEACTLAAALAGLMLPQGSDADRAVQDLRGLAPQALVEHLKPLSHREYSIASLPEDGTLELLVRQHALPNGELGLGSGWLTAHAPLGSEILLRVRENRAFHAPAEDLPLILIGNGTGLAGLRAHLKARARLGRYRNWLLFGERNAAHDYFFRDEIEQWRANGVLQRLDLAFSRDQTARIYVQQRLAAAAAEVRRWVADGASIYVCGSLAGMAPAVTEVLVDVLGQTQMDALIDQGRYRRDVY